ncbi:MAG: polysaccharide biosynthesis/export family protein [Pseudomonadota bacterium]
MLKIKMCSRTHFIILGLLAMLLLASCGPSTNSTIQEVGRDEIVVKELDDATKAAMSQEILDGLKQGMTRYTLNPGDVLEIMYHIDLIKLNTPYQIGVQDEVNVEFQTHPGLNRTVVVRPDGVITLPIKGDFEIGGETPKHSAEIIAQGYSDILRNPVVTVTVNKFSSKIFALQKAITNSPRGQAKRIPVNPDGNIYLPLLDGLKAAGKTIDEMKKEIQMLYEKEFKNLEISLLVESIVGRQIFVFGQVFNPGKLKEDHPITVAQAVAEAGGVNGEGTVNHVKVLLVSPDNKLIIRTVNLARIIEEGHLEEDVLLPDNSVVYVPKTNAAKTGQWVDDYIRRIFTWNGVGFTFNYDVRK